MVTDDQRRMVLLARARKRKAEAANVGPQELSGQKLMGLLNRGISTSVGAPVDIATAGINRLATADRNAEYNPIGEKPSGNFIDNLIPENPLTAVNKGFNAIGGIVDQTGIGELLRGMGVDPISNPIGGSENLGNIMRGGGASVAASDYKADGFLENMIEGTGSAAGSLVTGGGIAKLFSGVNGAAGNAAKEGLETLARRPATYIGAELASGAGSGVGLELANEVAPDSPAAQTIGQILGGVLAPAGVLNPIRIGGNAISKGIKRIATPFTESGARVRSEDYIRGGVSDAEGVASKLDDETITNLTPAQRSGEKALIELENAAAEFDPNIAKSLAKRKEDNMSTLDNEISNIRGEGDVGDLQSHLGGRQEKLTQILDDRLNKANQAVESKIAKMTPRMREAQASGIAREELEGALSQSRAQEKQLWNKIPEDVLVEKKNIKSSFDELIKETPRAQQGDIPKSLMNRFFAQPPQEKLNLVNERGEPLIGNAAPQTDSLREFQGLRSKLLEESRIARSDGNYNKARIHDDLAEAVLEDMGAVSGRVQGDIGRSIRDAIDFSRGLNEKFTRGEVGKVLGFAKEGGAKTAPELTLQKLIGGGRVKGDVALRQMLDAADTPELRDSVENFVKEKLENAAIKNGKVNSAAAKQFAKDNSDILDKFPDLRKEIDNLSQANDSFLARTKKTEGIKKALTNESKNNVSKFINAAVDKEFDMILRSKNPTKFMKELVNRASKDTTGKASAGLRASAIDYIMKKSTKEGALNGKSLLDNINRDKKLRDSLSEVLKPDEMQRLRKIGGELNALQQTGKTGSSIINDDPSKLLETFLSIHGANWGASLGKGAGSIQTANIGSNRVKSLFRKITKDKAEEILKQAVEDKDLMKALLTDRTSTKTKKLADQRLEFWLLGPGSNLLDSEEE